MGSEQRNALVAVVLSGLILFGWQYYFAPPKAPVAAPVGPTVSDVSNSTPAPTTATSAPSVAPIEPVTTEEFNLAGAGVGLTFDSFLTVKNFENTQAAFNFKDTVNNQSPMKIEFDFGSGFQSLAFSKAAENKFFNASNDLTVLTTVSDKGVMSFNATSTRPFKYRFIFKTEDKKLENGQQRVFAWFTDELTHATIGEEEAGDRGIKWGGIDFNYHLFAAYFDKPQDLLFKSAVDSTFTMFSNKSTNQMSYSLVFVKKEYNYLSSLGHNLNNSVDFGIWGFFAVWILKGLQFFHTFVSNYGVCIILLTLLVRLITFPLQYKSFVSMKKLQVIQPELNKIREKFKDDPQRMQKESMDLFKKSGANPLGGCLPLLLQMPVFFAFYKVLHSAVELVGAPFVLWIGDLSNKDPYYVLPVLMTIAMFLQQKMTPNTITDPVQKKVMTFMPLIFGFIMKDLPSGLSLYIFVSTLFGIIQQSLVFNSKSSSAPVVV
jgi:YidC/Oxa1 family membrane protein insertase